VPLNFLAVRMAESLIHPRVFATSSGGLPDSMMYTFLVCLVGITLLFITLVKIELVGKSTRGQINRLRRNLHGDQLAAPTGGRIAPEMETR